ncbi:MAG: PD-(D/E)XK nuclease family protein, partial [Clostridia bacterium]|nr:PD-(D/E)XK nuclease family protein [Clostridia bacterium]
IRKIINDSIAENTKAGVKASDFIVIARDTSVYEDALSIACKRNGIDVFIDKKLPLIEMPVAVATLKAMEFAVCPNVKSIIDYYKTGICGLLSDEISALETYTYLWGLTVKDFNDEWDMNPNGFDTELKGKDKSELENLNKIRIKAIEPLNKFREEFKNTSAADMAKAVYNLVSSDCIKENLLSLYNENNNNGNEIYAAAIKKSYSALIFALDSIVTCYTRSNVSKQQFLRSFENALKLETVGVTPQKDNQIIFGGADRVITSSPSYVFIMGANQGTFPKISANTGLFSDIDIETLNEMGLNIPQKTVDFALEEELLVYLNVTSATQKVFISFSKLKPDNTSAFPSPFVSQIKRLKVDERKEPDTLSKANLPQTFEASKNELLKRLNDADGGAKTVESAIAKTDEEWLNNYKKIKTTAEEAKIDPDIAEKYFGNEIFLSASAIEGYNKCKFAYFCEKIAKAKPRKKVEITAMNRGLIAHYVLENFIKDHTEKGDIKTVCQDDIENEVDLLTNEYLSSIKGFIKKQDYASEYAVKSLKRTLVDYLIRAVEDFANSDFLPIEYEYKIGRDAVVQYIIDIDDTGKKIKINGSIDRVDAYDGNIRIVDYKTGHKSFELCEIPHGKNMQTLIYLNAYLKNNADTSKAGFIYSKLERLKGERYDPQCLIVDDSLIISAMDNNETRKFIPEHKTKKTEKVGNRDKYLKDEKYDTLLDFVEGKIIETGKSLYDGNIKPKPLKSGQSIHCDYCEYSKICGVKNKNPNVLSKDDVKLIFGKEE